MFSGFSGFSGVRNRMIISKLFNFSRGGRSTTWSSGSLGLLAGLCIARTLGVPYRCSPRRFRSTVPPFVSSSKSTTLALTVAYKSSAQTLYCFVVSSTYPIKTQVRPRGTSLSFFPLASSDFESIQEQHLYLKTLIFLMLIYPFRPMNASSNEKIQVSDCNPSPLGSRFYKYTLASIALSQNSISSLALISIDLASASIC